MSWEHLPIVPPDGLNWPLPFAADILDVPETVLRKGIKDEGIAPAGVIRMAEFRRSGRHPKAYPSAELVRIAEAFRACQQGREE